MIGAIFNASVAAAMMVPVSVASRAIPFGLGMLAGTIVAILGLNNARATVDICQRGIRIRSLFKSLDISLDGVAHLGWNSKFGTVVDYRDGSRAKTGKLLSQEIYNYLVMPRVASPPRAVTQQKQTTPSDLGNVTIVFKANNHWMSLAAVGCMFFPVLFFVFLFKANPNHQPNSSRIFWLACTAFFGLLFFFLAYLDESRRLELFEKGVAYRSGRTTEWSCLYSQIAGLSHTGTTHATQFFGVIPVAESISQTGIILYLSDGQSLKADQIANIPLAVGMIQRNMQSLSSRRFAKPL
jgi:lipid-A-disaccharide synthase-like uncharacterized protein